MSVEEHLPAGPDPDNDALTLAGLRIAAQWGQAPGGVEQFKLALSALEPRAKRAHQIRLRELDLQERWAERAAERIAREAEAKRHHTYRMATLIAGMVASIAMLGSAIYVAPDNAWLAAGLCGPSMLALVKIFVLKKSDDADMRAAGRTAREAANVGAQPPGGPVP